MKILILLFFISSIYSNDDKLTLKLLTKVVSTENTIAGVDNLNNVYFINNNELIKSSRDKN